MTSKAKPGKAKRRVPMSARRLEEVLKVAIACGITPTVITHHPDGRTEVQFGPDERKAGTQFKPTNQGWNILDYGTNGVSHYSSASISQFILPSTKVRH